MGLVLSVIDLIHQPSAKFDQFHIAIYSNSPVISFSTYERHTKNHGAGFFDFSLTSVASARRRFAGPAVRVRQVVA